jgi:hypothetical protein
MSPDWFKRAIFVTSFYSRYNDITEPTLEAMEPLVKSMHLVKDPNALMLFTQYRGVGNKVVIEDVRRAMHFGSTDTIRGIFLNIVNATPSWLQYSRKDDMVNDLMKATMLSITAK